MSYAQVCARVKVQERFQRQGKALRGRDEEHEALRDASKRKTEKGGRDPPLVEFMGVVAPALWVWFCPIDS